MDLIDRQALYAAFESLDWYYDAIKTIEDAPTVEPKRGKWIYKKGKPYCSECGSAKPYFDGEILSYWVGDYCRMCGAFLGADMRGAEDE